MNYNKIKNILKLVYGDNIKKIILWLKVILHKSGSMALSLVKFCISKARSGMGLVLKALVLNINSTKVRRLVRIGMRYVGILVFLTIIFGVVTLFIYSISESGLGAPILNSFTSANGMARIQSWVTKIGNMWNEVFGYSNRVGESRWGNLTAKGPTPPPPKRGVDYGTISNAQFDELHRLYTEARRRGTHCYSKWYHFNFIRPDPMQPMPGTFDRLIGRTIYSWTGYVVENGQEKVLWIVLGIGVAAAACGVFYFYMQFVVPAVNFDVWQIDMFTQRGGQPRFDRRTGVATYSGDPQADFWEALRYGLNTGLVTVGVTLSALVVVGVCVTYFWAK
jgi:hypothetical protein